MYLTRRIEHREDIRSLSAIKDTGRYAATRAAEKFDDLYKQSSAAGGWYKTAGTNAAREAAGRVHDRYWPGEEPSGDGGVDSVRAFARSAATEGYQSARDGLGGLYGAWSASGTVREGFSNIVAQARAQARGDSGPSIGKTEVEDEESTIASGEPDGETAAGTSSLPTVANLLSAESTKSKNTGAVKGGGLL